MIIYTPYITNRFLYVIDHVFNEHFKIEYLVTNDVNAFYKNDDTIKLVYDEKPLEQGLFFYADGLLNETVIKQTNLKTKTLDDVPVLFAHNQNATLSFDIFSAIFYLLSRYEEYIGASYDEHENYNHQSSILYKLNALQTSLVEEWLLLLEHILLQHFPSIQLKKNKPRYLLSFDIDEAFAHKHKGFFRSAASALKKIVSLRINDLKDQLQTLFNLKNDMYETYQYLLSKIKDRKAIFFLNMGKHAKYDKNPSAKNKAFQDVISQIKTKYLIGLHPSYASNKKVQLIAAEKQQLEKIVSTKIINSRQHYLKLKFPSTYRNLLNNKVENDFTIGYSKAFGFRAGTCNSFLFFDVLKNETTSLRLYPFAYMDGTLNRTMKLNIEEAKEQVEKLIQITHKNSGIFIPLWHNSTLTDVKEWKGWREVFEYTLQRIDELKFDKTGLL